MCRFMLGCAGFSEYCHILCAHKCKMRRNRGLNTGLDLAGAALRIAWGGGGKLNGCNIL